MNWKRFFAAVFALLVVLSLSSTRVNAQTQSTGDVTGIVTDQSGAIVPNAKVTLKDNAKGSTQDATTNKDGSYRFYLLPPGSYTVSVSAPGFASQSRGADINVGQIATLSFSLSVGTSNTTVTVTEAAPLLQSDNGNVATTLSQEQISQIPNPGNDMSYIAQLSPGAVMNTGMGYGNFSSYGTPGTSNLFTLDGMDDNDPFLNLNNSGATNLLLGANEVQEATVVNGAYTGEYGTLAGASVNYVTKSGGNDFHGNAIYYWNGSAMNANDWFNVATDTPKSFDNANQWAGSFGGPIKKDKLFFFVNTEGLRVILPSSVRTLIPTVGYENQVLADLTAQGLTASIPFYQKAFNLYNTANGAANAVPFDTGANGAPPPCLGELAVVPADGCILQFRSTNPNFTHEWLLSGRVDWNIGSKDKAFLRVGYDHGVQATFTDTINSVFNGVSDQPQWQGQFQETHVFNSTLVNQLIVSGAWYSAIFNNPDRTAALNAFPTALYWLDGAYTAVGRALYDWPQGRNVTQYQISDDLSKTFGNQTIKGGIKFRRNDVTDYDFGFYTAGREYSDLATFDAGQADLLYQNFANSGLKQPMATYSFAAYGEDDWKVKSNLTLTFALRAEHFSNPVCQTNCFARLTGPFADVTHDPAQPYNEAINSNLHQALQGMQAIAWSPRFGFAWQPFGGEHNLVVRGGVGIFYDQFPAQVVDNFSQNPPLYNSFFPACFQALCGVGPSSPQAFLSPDETSGPNAFGILANSNSQFVTGFNSGATLGSLQATNPLFSPPSIFTANATTKVPQYQKWSLEVQKGFGADTVIQVGYYGNHGIHELIEDGGLNAFASGALPFSLPAEATDPRFSTVTFADTHAVSNYNGVTGTFTQRIHGWGSGVISASYTYSHGFDEVSNGGLLPFVASSNVSPLTPQIPGNYRNNYGSSDYDVRNYFTLSYVWQVPIRRMLGGHGWAPLVEGWQVSGAIFARSGLPYTVIDSSFTGTNNYNNTIYGTFDGSAVPSCGTSAASLGAGGTGTPCLSATQFSEPDFAPYGARNRFRGPGYTDVDFSVIKNTKIPHWERGSLGLGVQFFNLFNHPNFDQPVNDLASPSFGQVISTISTPTSILGAFLGGDASPRIIQLKASLTF
jgi:hypothetical protein